MTDEPQPAHKLIYTPAVTPEGDPYLVFTWGEQQGKFAVADAFDAGFALLDTIARAEHDAAMYRYLLTAPDATPDGAARILQRFRAWRHEEQAAAGADFEPGA